MTDLRFGTLLRIGSPLLALVFVLSVAADEVTHVNTSSEATATGAPLAVHGYDTVAYFTEGRAVPGKEEFSTVHDGATYRFASAANQEKFEGNPESYLPQYGGFCAYGVTVGKKVDIDPEAFAVVDGKLYLNYSLKIQKKWNKDVSGYIKKAEEAWPKLRDKDE